MTHELVFSARRQKTEATEPLIAVDMDRDRFDNSITPGENRAAREGMWCP